MSKYYFKEPKYQELNKMIAGLGVFEAMRCLVDWVAKNDIELLQVIVFDNL